MTPEEKELLESIEEMVRRSKAGEMPWKRINPTTFTWDRRWNDGGARLSIQKTTKRETVKSPRGVVRRQAVDHFVFQAIDLQTSNTMVSINSDETAEFHAPLRALFDAAASTVTKKGIGFLRKAIEP